MVEQVQTRKILTYHDGNQFEDLQVYSELSPELQGIQENQRRVTYQDLNHFYLHQESDDKSYVAEESEEDENHCLNGSEEQSSLGYVH